MITRICIALTLFLTACKSQKVTTFEIDQPEHVVSQTVISLGNNFYEVHRSQINPPKHWEGIGHFTFVFFKTTKICQCDSNNVTISPDGKYIIYVSQNRRRLEILNIKNNEVKALSDSYIGYPKTADWNLKKQIATLDLAHPNRNTPRSIEIDLE